MFKRIFIIIVSVLLAVLVGAFFLVPPQIVEISEDQISEGLEENLPYSVNKWGARITVQRAQVQLSDENKIVVDAWFVAEGATLEGEGKAAVNSAIRYDDGKFYLSDLKHEDVAFEFSDNSKDTISEVRSALEGILRRETDEANESGNAVRIDQLSRANEYYESKLKTDAVALLDDFLGSFPIYNLERAGGGLRLAALALDDVQITSDKVLITLSLQTLILRLAAIVGSFLFVIAIVFGPFATALKIRN